MAIVAGFFFVVSVFAQLANDTETARYFLTIGSIWMVGAVLRREIRARR